MKSPARRQSESLHSIITMNVSIFRDLLKQSQKFQSIIDEIESNAENSKLKESLVKVKTDTFDDIEILVKQTEKLTDTYGKIVNEIFL